jgi:hypothetical protein
VAKLYRQIDERGNSPEAADEFSKLSERLKHCLRAAKRIGFQPQRTALTVNAGAASPMPEGYHSKTYTRRENQGDNAVHNRPGNVHDSEGALELLQFLVDDIREQIRRRRR